MDKSNFMKEKLKTFLNIERKIKIFALSGIDESRIEECKELGFDGVALLGAIWNNPQFAISNFQLIII